jgi:tol-pal system protein YbgF
MKLNKVLLGMSFVAATYMVVAAEPAPVIDVTKTPIITASSQDVNERIANLERQLEASNRARVSVQRQLDEQQNEVNELRGITELHTHQLSQVLERQRELYQELDRRVSQALVPAEVPVAIAVPKTASGQPITYSADLPENDAYDRAVNMVLKDKNYELAIPEFQKFNQQYPNSSYAPNAYYWLGQLLFNKADFVQAKNAFQVVVEQYQDSAKRSDAMLKLGMVEQKLNNKAMAIKLYKQVIAEYPASTAAQLAPARLDSIGS